MDTAWHPTATGAATRPPGAGMAEQSRAEQSSAEQSGAEKEKEKEKEPPEGASVLECITAKRSLR